MAGANVNIIGGAINIGDQFGFPFGAMLGELMVALFDAHVHPTTAPGAPTLPPVPPIASLKGTPAFPVAEYVKIKVGRF